MTSRHEDGTEPGANATAPTPRYLPAARFWRRRWVLAASSGLLVLDLLALGIFHVVLVSTFGPDATIENHDPVFARWSESSGLEPGSSSRDILLLVDITRERSGPLWDSARVQLTFLGGGAQSRRPDERLFEDALSALERQRAQRTPGTMTPPDHARRLRWVEGMLAERETLATVVDTRARRLNIVHATMLVLGVLLAVHLFAGLALPRKAPRAV